MNNPYQTTRICNLAMYLEFVVALDIVHLASIIRDPLHDLTAWGWLLMLIHLNVQSRSQQSYVAVCVLILLPILFLFFLSMRRHIWDGSLLLKPQSSFFVFFFNLLSRLKSVRYSTRLHDGSVVGSGVQGSVNVLKQCVLCCDITNLKMLFGWDKLLHSHQIKTVHGLNLCRIVSLSNG